MSSIEENALIYIVEDHAVIREGVQRYLELYSFEVETFGTIRDATEAFEKKVPDLLIQDVMLPDGDGFEFVKEIKSKYTCPVIFMTAKISESDRILGFELGCDDYILKPFSPKELVLRVKAVLRRTMSSPKDMSDIYTVENNTLKIDSQTHKLYVNDNEVVLTAAEWRILEHLMKNAHLLVTRSQILEECFDYNYESYERIVDTHIKNLRAKLGDGNWIETVRGYGYRFIGEESID